MGELPYPWLVDPIDHPMGDYEPLRQNYLISDFLADAHNQSLGWRGVIGKAVT